MSDTKEGTIGKILRELEGVPLYECTCCGARTYFLKNPKECTCGRTYGFKEVCVNSQDQEQSHQKQVKQVTCGCKNSTKLKAFPDNDDTHSPPS